MKSLKERIHQIVSLIQSVKDENLEWQATNQSQQIKLSHDRRLAEQKLVSELTKKGIQLAHEIKLMKTTHEAELAMLKTRCNEEINDYQHYLESLNQLKGIIKASYTHLPDALINTIHHHAKALLNTMWDAKSVAEKIALEAQLIKFMSTVHEEAGLFRDGALTSNFPESTLKLMGQDSKQMPPH